MQKNTSAGHAAWLFICCPLKNWRPAEEFSATSQLTDPKYLLPNITFTSAPRLESSFFLFVKPILRRINWTVSLFDKRISFYIPMQGHVSHIGAVKKTILGVKLLYCSSIGKHPDISGRQMRQGQCPWDTFKGDLSKWVLTKTGSFLAI